MLKFNIIPTAKVLTKNDIRIRKINAHYSDFSYKFVLAVIVLMVMALAGISGHFGIIFSLFGVIWITFGIGAYHLHEKNDGEQSTSPATCIAIGCCIIVFVFCLAFGLGFAFFMKCVIAAIAIKEIILPLTAYFMLKKRVEVCTEKVTAYNLDIVSDDYLYGDKSINYDSYDDSLYEYGTGDDIEDHVRNSGSYCLEGYEYIYIADGKRYILTLPYSYTRTQENRSRRITLNIDPEHPERFYYPLYMPLRKLSDVIGCMLIYSIITAVLVWIVFLR